MPGVEELLEQVTALARAARGVALAWHVVVVLGLGLVLVGRWRPRVTLAAALGAAPLLSAGVLALSSGNPFNGTVLCVAALVLASLGAGPREARVAPGPAWATAVGLGAVAFALVYPHFVPVERAWDLAFTPVGVVPCPSLALVLGVGLLADAFGSRAWALTAAGLGLFYGVVGVARLGVWLDVGLLVAAAALLARAPALRAPAARLRPPAAARRARAPRAARPSP